VMREALGRARKIEFIGDRYKRAEMAKFHR
jgi:hypothetical protein